MFIKKRKSVQRNLENQYNVLARTVKKEMRAAKKNDRD